MGEIVVTIATVIGERSMRQQLRVGSANSDAYCSSEESNNSEAITTPVTTVRRQRKYNGYYDSDTLLEALRRVPRLVAFVRRVRPWNATIVFTQSNTYSSSWERPTLIATMKTVASTQ